MIRKLKDVIATPTGALKFAASGFLLYHFAAVTLFPMGNSILVREFSPYFRAYVNQLGFNTTWQFFSPGPSPTFYLEYVIEDADGVESAEAHYVPEKREGFGWSDSYSRRLYSMRYFALDPERLAKYLVPVLCRRHPEAAFITTRQVVKELESLDSARLSNVDQSQFSDFGERKTFPPQRHACDRAEATP